MTVVKARGRAEEVYNIHEDLHILKESDVAQRMYGAFGWLRACYHYPKLTPEEIASMAASTFERVHLLEMPS